MGVLEPNDVGAEFGQFQPVWDLALEHAAFAPVVAGPSTLASDHQNEFRTFRLCSAQKRKQPRIGRALGLAVKVDARIDRCGAARKALPEPPIKWLELGRRSSRSRHEGRAGGCLCRGSNGWCAGAVLVAAGVERAGALKGALLSGAGEWPGSASTRRRRSGATDRVISLQSLPSSALSRRGLPSPALITLAAIARGRPAGAVFFPGFRRPVCPAA